MTSIRILALAISLILRINCLFAQAPEIPQTIRKGVIYKKERSFDMAIQSNGFYVGYNKAKINKFYYSNYFHIDLGKLKDPREQKINQANLPGSFIGNYIYGKRNDLWNLRIGRGYNRYLSEKSRKKGVAVALRLEGGLLLGLLKPYYIKVRERVDNVSNIIDLKYSEDKKDQFLTRENILGASSSIRGIGELSIKPGAFGRIGIAFDPGAYEKIVRSLMFGLSVDLYSGRVPIMANEKNRFIFANFYLALQFGKRK